MKRQPAVVEERRPAVGVAEVGGDLRHARQRVGQLGPNRMVAEHLIALEQVSKDLAAVGGRAFVVAAGRQHLLVKLLLQVLRPRAHASAVPRLHRRTLPPTAAPSDP
jgi:hypothetical protein